MSETRQSAPDRIWLDLQSGEPGFYGEDHYTGDTVYCVSDATSNPWPEGVEYIRADRLRCKHGVRWPHECRDCFQEFMEQRR